MSQPESPLVPSPPPASAVPAPQEASTDGANVAEKELQQATAFIAARREVRMRNLLPEAHRLTSAKLREMKADLKKAGIFARKIKDFTIDKVASILQDLNTLNVNMFVSEAAQALPSAINDGKMKLSDVGQFVSIMSAMHQKYEAFLPDALQCLKKSFSLAPVLEEMTKKLEPGQPATDVARVRIAVRVFAEMWLVGLLPNAALFKNIFSSILQVLESKKEAHFTANSLSIVGLIVRTVGIELLGFPGHAALNDADPAAQAVAKAHCEARLADRASTTYASRDEAEEIRNLLETILSKANDTCAKTKKSVEAKWLRLCESIELKGESTDLKEKFTNMKKEADKIFAQMNQIALMMGKPESCVAPIDLTQALAGSAVDPNAISFQSAMSDYYTVKEAETINYFEDEDERAFYQTLPDLILPPGVPETVGIKSLGRSLAAQDDDEQPDDQSDRSLAEFAVADQLLRRLPQCAAREYIDAWTLEYFAEATRYYHDGKGRDASLGHLSTCLRMATTELRFASTTAPELLPFYARCATVLSKHFREVGEILITKLDGELQNAVARKAQDFFSRKMRAARYLSELVKFRLAPPIRVLRHINTAADTLDDQESVKLIIAMLESAGPFLMRGGVTRQKLEEILTKIHSRNHLVAVGLDALLENAISLCKCALLPRTQRRTRGGRLQTPVEKYVRHLLFKELAEDDEVFLMVRDTMRKMPWTDRVTGDLLAHVMRKVHKCSWDRIHLLVDIISDISEVHGWVAINIVDAVLEDLRLDLEIPNYRTQQKISKI